MQASDVLGGLFHFKRRCAGRKQTPANMFPGIMPYESHNAAAASVEIATRITEALARERVVPRFVASYVLENGPHALQVHASLYRDLLALLQREALLALT